MELIQPLAVAFLVILSLHSAYSLQCYNCSSIIDERCGEIWKFKGSEGNKYKVDCPANSTHCVKHITLPHRDTFVYRTCWTPWENYTITRKQECTEIGKETEVCICADPNKPCNRENILTASVPEILIGAVLSLIGVLY